MIYVIVLAFLLVVYYASAIFVYIETKKHPIICLIPFGGIIYFEIKGKW